MLTRTIHTEASQAISNPKEQWRLEIDMRTRVDPDTGESTPGPHVRLDVFLDDGGSFSHPGSKGTVSAEALEQMRQTAETIFRESLKLNGFSDDGSDAKPAGISAGKI